MSKTVLGIELGSENMKVALMTSTGNQFKVLQHRIVKLSEKARDHDDHLNVIEVKTTLDQIIKEMNIKRVPVCLTINSPKKIIRTRELPMASLTELEGIVRYEAEQFLPYDIDHFYVDYRVIGNVKNPLSSNNSVNVIETTPTESNIIKVMIVALPKEIVDSYRDLMKECGLVLKSITVHADSLYQFAINQILVPDHGIIICDIGQKSINTVLFEGMEFFADISSEQGIESICEFFSESYGTNFEESHNCLFGKGIVKLSKKDSGNDQLYKRIERLNLYFEEKESHPDLADDTQIEQVLDDHDTLDNAQDLSQRQISSEMAIQDIRKELYSPIFKEVNRMIEFYRTRKFGATVNEIYLCGGGASFVGLEAFIKESTGIEVVKTNMLKNESHSNLQSEFNLLVSAVGGAIGR